MNKTYPFIYSIIDGKVLIKISYAIIFLMIFSFAEGTELEENGKESLIKTEYEFAEVTKKSTIKDGFLKFIDDDGILFRPHPVNGKEFLEKSPANPGLLLWYPSFSEISKAGDLGVNKGPWEFKRSENEESVAFGNFVTVWQKQKDGTWKFLIDVGNSNPKPKDVIEPLKVENHSSSITDYNSSKADEFDRLINIEEKVNSDEGYVYSNFVIDETVYLRNGINEIKGKDIIKHLSAQPENHEWETMGGKVSASNDLGYTYGKIAFKEKANFAGAYYLHVWKKDKEENWNLLIDVLNEIPLQQDN